MGKSNDIKVFVEIVEGWSEMLERLPDQGPVRMLQRLLETAERAERSHRRLVGSHYRGTCRDAAAYFAVRAVVQANPRAPIGELSVLREDYQIGGLLAAYPLGSCPGFTHDACVRNMLLRGASWIVDKVNDYDYVQLFVK